MKRIFSLLVALALFATAPKAFAQGGGAGFDFKAKQVLAADFNLWMVFSSTAVTAGAATITIEDPRVTIPGFPASINPIKVNSKLLVDTGSLQETVTITAISCAQPVPNCTATATFGNAHSGRYQITSGSYGAQEALDYVTQALGGSGSVIIQPLFVGATSIITGLVRGSTNISVEDWRSGNVVYYGWTGSAYASVLSISATAVTINGGAVAATANSAGTGTVVVFADTGNPAAGTTGTNTTGVANQLWYTQMFFPTNFTITNLAIMCGGTCTTDKIAMGVWSTTGTLLAVTSATVAAGTTLSGANTWQKIALTAPLAVSGPGRYIVGVVTSGATAGDIQTYPLAAGPVCAVAGAQGTLATFTPVTTTTVSSCPYVFAN